MTDPLHVPTTNSYRCLDASDSGIYTLLDCVEVTSAGSVTPTSGSPDYLAVASANGVVSDVEVALPLGEKFTFCATFNAASLPADFDDLTVSRFFLGAYNASGKCAGVLLSQQGAAFVDAPGSVAVPIPGTAEVVQQFVGEDVTLCLIVDENGMANVLYSIDGGESGVLFVAAAPSTPAGYDNGVLLEVLGQVASSVSLNLWSLQCDCYRVVLPFALELPVAVPGPDRSSIMGEPVVCDASGSYGYRDQPELVDENLRYRWSLVLAPDGSRFKVYDYNGSAADDGDGDPFTTVFSALPGASLFSAANAPLLKPGDTLVLSRSGAAYSYTVSSSRWKLENSQWVRDLAAGWNDDEIVVETDSIPIAWTGLAWAVYHTATFLHDPSARVTYAIPDVAGLFELQLVVNTTLPTYSSPVTMLLNVQASASALGVVPDVSFIWSYLSNFWDLLEDRDKVATIWSGFAQAAANILLTAWQIDYNKSLKDIQRTFQRRWLSYAFKIPDVSTDIRISRGPLGTMSIGTQPWAVDGKYLDLLIDGGSRVRVVFDGGGSDLSTDAVVEQINTALVAAGYPALAAAVRTVGGQLLPQIVYDGLVQSIVTDTASSAAIALGWVRFHPNVEDISEEANTQNEVWGDGYIEPYVLATTGQYVGKLKYFNLSTTRLAEDLPTRVSVGDLIVFEAGFRNVYEGTTLVGVDRFGSPTGWRYFAALCTGYQNPSGSEYFMQTTFDLPPASEGQWFIPSVVVSENVDFQESGVVRDDLAVFSVRDLATGISVDIHCSVQVAYKKQLAFDPRPLLIKWNGYPANYETTFTGVLRTQAIPVDDLVVSIPRLQVQIADSTDALEEGRDYSIKRVEVNGVQVNAIVFRAGTFAPQDPPVSSYWAEQTHLDNSPAIEANFGHLVPPLSSRSYKDWKEELPNLDYLSAVRGLWYAYWGGPSVYRMRVGVQILLGLPFAEEAGTVVEVNDLFSSKEGRLLVQDKNGAIVRSYFYPRAVGPSTFRVGDSVEKFAPLCGGVEILDWVNSPSWGENLATTGALSRLQRYFKFMLRGNADAFDPAHLIFAADFIKNIKPHYTDVITVLQKVFTNNIDVEDSVATTVKMKVVQSTDPLVRGALRWDDYDGAGVIRHQFDEDPIQFVWDHQGLSPRQQVTVLSSADLTSSKILSDLQGISGSDGSLTAYTLPGSGTLTRVVVIVRAPVRGPDSGDYGTMDLAAGSSIVTGVKLSDSQGSGTYVALDLSELSVACSGQALTATFHANGFTWAQATAGSVQFYLYIS